MRSRLRAARVPDEGGSRPARILSSVDLPEPFGPTSPTWSPSNTPSDRSSKSGAAPNALCSSWQETSSSGNVARCDACRIGHASPLMLVRTPPARQLGRAAAVLLASLALVAAASADPPIPLERARNVLEEARLACAEDAGALWGLSLCGPLLLVDPQSRFTVASEADGGGVLRAEGSVFAGVLPPDVVVANTATRWGGTLWTMVMWPSIGPRPAQQRRLLMHESFHRIQADLGLPAANTNNPHLDSLEGR